jgi:hypothetical protein
MIRRVALIPFLAFLVACDSNGVSRASVAANPVGPSSTIASTSGDATVVSGPMRADHDVVVNILDACDGDSFNAILGAGTCNRAGGVKFDHFIAELTHLGSIGAWRFAGLTGNVQVGEDFVATNQGGEVHTFTEVAAFGGGLVPLLNELSHVPDVAPECRPEALEPDDFVPPGGTYRERVSHTGHLKFQCCIHPWMRLEASSR